MGRAFEFLRECGVFFLLTSYEGCPHGRPFGSVAEINRKLYFATGRCKDVYTQIHTNPFIQIMAINPDSKAWIRISGIALEQKAPEIRSRIFTECPVLQFRFSGSNDPNLAVFAVEEAEVEFHPDE